MSIDMSFPCTKPSSSITNFHGIISSTTPSTTTSFTYSSSRLHLQQLHHVFHFHPSLTSLHPYPRKDFVTVRGTIDSVPPPQSTPSSNPFPGKGWIAGLVISLLLPFLRSKWGPLLPFKREIDKDMEIIEGTVEALEKVAERVEKVAEEASEDLPEGELKNVARKIEKVAELVSEVAHLTDEAIDKVWLPNALINWLCAS